MTGTVVPITTTWTNLTVGTVNFSSKSGCTNVGLEIGGSNVVTTVELSYVAWVPVAQNFTTQAVTLGASGGPQIYSGSGTPTGCGATPGYPNGSLYINKSGTTGSMLYTCIGTTWTDIK